MRLVMLSKCQASNEITCTHVQRPASSIKYQFSSKEWDSTAQLYYYEYNIKYNCIDIGFSYSNNTIVVDNLFMQPNNKM